MNANAIKALKQKARPLPDLRVQLAVLTMVEKEAWERSSESFRYFKEVQANRMSKQSEVDSATWAEIQLQKNVDCGWRKL